MSRHQHPRLPAALLALLHTLGENASATKIINLLYLTDEANSRLRGQTITGIEYIRDSRGPNAKNNRVAQTLRTLSERRPNHARSLPAARRKPLPNPQEPRHIRAAPFRRPLDRDPDRRPQLRTHERQRPHNIIKENRALPEPPKIRRPEPAPGPNPPHNPKRHRQRPTAPDSHPGQRRRHRPAHNPEPIARIPR